MEDAELDIRLRKESYVLITLAKDAPGVSYPQVVEAVKQGSYKMDDLSWGAAPEFKGKRETG